MVPAWDSTVRRLFRILLSVAKPRLTVVKSLKSGIYSRSQRQTGQIRSLMRRAYSCPRTRGQKVSQYGAVTKKFVTCEKLSDVSASQYDAVSYVGGHGSVIDLASDLVDVQLAAQVSKHSLSMLRNIVTH